MEKQTPDWRTLEIHFGREVWEFVYLPPSPRDRRHTHYHIDYAKLGEHEDDWVEMRYLLRWPHTPPPKPHSDDWDCGRDDDDDLDSLDDVNRQARSEVHCEPTVQRPIRDTVNTRGDVAASHRYLHPFDAHRKTNKPFRTILSWCRQAAAILAGLWSAFFSQTRKQCRTRANELEQLTANKPAANLAGLCHSWTSPFSHPAFRVLLPIIVFFIVRVPLEHVRTSYVPNWKVPDEYRVELDHNGDELSRIRCENDYRYTNVNLLHWIEEVERSTIRPSRQDVRYERSEQPLFHEQLRASVAAVFPSLAENHPLVFELGKWIPGAFILCFPLIFWAPIVFAVGLAALRWDKAKEHSRIICGFLLRYPVELIEPLIPELVRDLLIKKSLHHPLTLLQALPPAMAAALCGVVLSVSALVEPETHSLVEQLAKLNSWMARTGKQATSYLAARPGGHSLTHRIRVSMQFATVSRSSYILLSPPSVAIPHQCLAV